MASLWSICLRTLEADLSEQYFNTWVRPLQAFESEGVLKLLAPNRFAVEWVNNNLLRRIGELLRGATAGGAPIITVEIGSRARPEAPASTTPPVSGGSMHSSGAKVCGCRTTA